MGRAWASPCVDLHRERQLWSKCGMVPAMPELAIPSAAGAVPSYVTEPSCPGPWPGVVVVHDALGMSADLREQTHWLAQHGFLAAAPDLFGRGGRWRCMFRVMRDVARGTEGPAFDALRAVRSWLLSHPQASGKVGIIGFCLGGGFALMLAPGHGYDASAPNYGGMSEAHWGRMAQACPIVASYGGDDPTLRGVPARLDAVLTQHAVAHDVKVYPGVGHGFMNNHDPSEVGPFVKLLARVSNTRYDAEATQDARRRIVAFFDQHLRG